MNFQKLPKLSKRDKVAILSPSFAAPGAWPSVYQLGLERIKTIFGLEPIEYPATAKIGASKEERSRDLIDAFENPEIKAVISSLGGDDQVTYVKNLPNEPFANNPKPYFGYSDNTHFMNHLWLNGIPSYYGGAVLTQFAMQGQMDEFTIKYLNQAFFEENEVELEASDTYNDIGLNWDDEENLNKSRIYEPNDGWHWDGQSTIQGITWGGCLESIDEMLRHGVALPTLEQFENVLFFAETSEEIPESDYVYRVFRALGERGILERIKGIFVGRPKAWEFNKPNDIKTKKAYKQEQRDVILKVARQYNRACPIVQNMDFGHTDPQICLPMASMAQVDSDKRSIRLNF